MKGAVGVQSALPASAYTKQTKCVTIRPGSVVSVKGVMSTFFPSYFLAPRSLSTLRSPLQCVTFSAFCHTAGAVDAARTIRSYGSH